MGGTISCRKQNKEARKKGLLEPEKMESSYIQDKSIVEPHAIAKCEAVEHCTRPEIISGLFDRFMKFSNIAELRLSDSKGCRLVVTAPLQAVTLDNLTDCQLVIAACSGSLFARNCKECRLAVASKETRLRDLQECSIFAWSSTGVVFESCTRVRLSAFLVGLPEDEEYTLQLKNDVQKYTRMAGLLNSDTFNVHNFTPNMADILVEEIARLSSKNEVWEFPPLAAEAAVERPRYSNLGIPCLFRSSNERETLVNCDAEALDVLTGQMFSNGSRLYCIKCIHNGPDFTQIAKHIFPHYCVLEGQQNVEQALNNAGLASHALLCDDVDLAALKSSFK